MSGRIRTIKPEWLEDELLALASDAARVLSMGLVLLADDYGNGRANPVQLCGKVFPGKVLDHLASALEELRKIRFVVLYEIDGQRYFHIRNWKKHQRVDKPGKPHVPPPPANLPEKVIFENLPDGLAKVPETSENITASRASEVVVQVLVGGPDPGQAGAVANEPTSQTRIRKPDPFTASLQQADPADRAVLEAWRDRFQKTDVVFTADRALPIAERRREGMTQQDALDVLAGAAEDPWFLRTGSKLSVAFSDRERFETYRDAGRALRGAAAKATGPVKLSPLALAAKATNKRLEAEATARARAEFPDAVNGQPRGSNVVSELADALAGIG